MSGSLETSGLDPPPFLQTREFVAPSPPSSLIQGVRPPAPSSLGRGQRGAQITHIQTESQASGPLTWRSAEGAQQKLGSPGRRESPG